MVHSAMGTSSKARADSTHDSTSAADILTDLDGKALTCKQLGEALAAQCRDSSVVGFAAVPGTEKRWPQSHSVEIHVDLGKDLPSTALFLKKIEGCNMPKTKSLHALRRDLASNRNEARFYREFAPVLVDRGVPLISTVLIDERLDMLDAPSTNGVEDEARLRSGGLFLLLDSAVGCFQTSPFSADQCVMALRMLARFHAGAWEDQELLDKAAARLQSQAGYWRLSQRGESEMRQMTAVWESYVRSFEHLAPELFRRPEILKLAERLEKISPWVSDALAAIPSNYFATLVHGDFKAMNIFLPGEKCESLTALPIDFQWTGVGYGMSDVAMHFCHSVASDAFEEGGEEFLVNSYLAELHKSLPARCSAKYTQDVAWRHFHLAILDWARMALSSFFKDASPETFAARADSPNVGLVYRDVRASFRFIQRVDKCLEHFEVTS